MTGIRPDPTAETTADAFSAAHIPVLSVDPGTGVTVRSLDASGCLRPQEARRISAAPPAGAPVGPARVDHQIDRHQEEDGQLHQQPDHQRHPAGRAQGALAENQGRLLPGRAERPLVAGSAGCDSSRPGPHW